MPNKLKQQTLFILVLLVSITPFILNLFGFDFASKSTNFLDLRDSFSDITSDDKFNAIKGGMHHALLEWSAVCIALIAGIASFLHYSRYKDVSVPIIGLALLCAGFTDAFHTLAATRIISASVPNTDFIPFTWAFSRVFNVILMILGISISLWIRRKAHLIEEGVNDNFDIRILSIVSILFIGVAIAAVVVAATSSQLPQTTFSGALITRPYDVIPLALFLFSGSLAWIWYQSEPTTLRFALLLSIIPEVATQVHMSFGSIALFDNHFNIAHGLKLFAYLCLLIGILFSLLSTSQNQNNKLKESNRNTLAPAKRPFVSKKLLDVGTAKYPQTLVIPSVIFVLSLLITALTSTTFFLESEKTALKQRMDQVRKEADFIEHLLKGVFDRAEHSLNFLSGTPPVQNIVRAIEQNDKPLEKIWKQRLQTIFHALLVSEPDFVDIQFVQFNSNNRQLIKSYRIDQRVYDAGEDFLKTTKLNFLNGHSIDPEGQISTTNIHFDELERKTNDSILSTMLPIYSKSKKTSFGAIAIKINLTRYIKKLELNKLLDRSLYITDEDGNFIYQAKSKSNTDNSFARNKKIQDIFPQLTNAVEENYLSFDVYKQNEMTSFQQELDSEATMSVTGNFRTMRLQTSDQKFKLRLLLLLDVEAFQNDLASTRNRSFLIGIGLAVIALGIAIVFSRKITQPMTQIIRQLTRYEYTGEVESLPVEATDEIGVFARSFHNMLAMQDIKDRELNQQKFAIDEHAIVSITNVKGDITYVNEKFCDISGYNHDELIGKNHRILNSGFHGIVFFKDMFAGLVAGKTWNGEICNVSKSGKIYWVQTTIVPIMNDKNKPVAYTSIRTDITLSKMNALELTETRDILSFQVNQLKEANADLDQFAYVASHDLKSPLNGISQLVTWIDEDCSEILPEESKEHLTLLKSRSRRMLNLLNDLLEYSRIGRDEHAIEKLNLKEVSQQLFELQGTCEGFTCKGQDVEFEVQRIPFEMVLRNLISNAIKHHDKEAGHIDISYELVTVNDKKLHQFRITDDGPGIPVDLQEKAMEMFQTLQSRDETEGSGMGLAIVKKMADKYDGSLEIESDGKRGTTFIVQWGV